MARRRPPASTPFGAWLARWFDENPDWTVEAFATAVRVSPAAVSLWLTKTKRVGQEHLREVARVTGEDFDALWKMVYGQPAPTAAVPNTTDLLDAFEERVRVVLREETAGYGSARAARPTGDLDEITRRRSYWLKVARTGTGASVAEVARRAGHAVADVKAWEKNAQIPDAMLEDVARGYELPLDVVQHPPETDHDVARTFRARFLAEQERVPLGEVVSERRAS